MHWSDTNCTTPRLDLQKFWSLSLSLKFVSVSGSYEYFVLYPQDLKYWTKQIRLTVAVVTKNLWTFEIMQFERILDFR